MSAELAHEGQQERRSSAEVAVRSWRARMVLALGPVTVLVGIAWALVQPYRLTLLHPHGQGFWWPLAEPPLYVIAVGIVFRLVARGLLEDLERQ